MKRILVAFAAFSLVVVAGLAFAGTRPGDLPTIVQQLNGSPTGQAGQAISVSTTSATQSTAISSGSVVEVVNDGSTKVYCKPVTSSSGTATTTTGRPLAADAAIVWTLASNETHVACITASGTSTARVYVYR